MTRNRFSVKTPAGTYPVVIGPDKSLMQSLLRESHNVVIVSNPTVFALHGNLFRQRFLPQDKDIHSIVIGEGERYKSRTTVEKLYDQFFDVNLSRKDTVIAFGGGAVGDTAGFAAATFKRGVRLIQAPTSLLAMVDSSIGGKVGINHRQGKNLIGLFYQPKAVIIDRLWTETLDEREFLSGLGEIVKVGFLSSKKFLDQVCALPIGNSRPLFSAAVEAMKFKSRIVAQDVNDNGLRMILNFGHTFAHAIEKVEGYKRYRHGEAVLAGIVGALYLSHAERRLTKANLLHGLEVLRPLIERLKPLKKSPDDYVSPMAVDKKNSGGKNMFVLLDDIGKPVVKPVVSRSKILDATAFMLNVVNRKR
ncbi:MAG: 3-dehydroquinate synthase [Candidatus Zixiibacteriota bacterium]